MPEASQISAILEDAFQKHGKSFMTVNQLVTEVGKKIGVKKTKKIENQKVKKALGDLPGPYVWYRKPGGRVYLIKAPLEQIMEEYVAGSPGVSLKQVAKDTPLTKPTAAGIVNTMLSMNRLRVEVKDDGTAKLFVAAAVDASSEPEPPADRADVPENPTEALKQAYDARAVGKRHVYVFELRRQLGWPRETFDRLLDRLMVEGAIAGFPGDPGQLSEDEVRDSFQGRDGDLYIAIAWRR